MQGDKMVYSLEAVESNLRKDENQFLLNGILFFFLWVFSSFSMMVGVETTVDD